MGGKLFWVVKIQKNDKGLDSVIGQPRLVIAESPEALKVTEAVTDKNNRLVIIPVDRHDVHEFRAEETMPSKKIPDALARRLDEGRSVSSHAPALEATWGTGTHHSGE